MLRVGNIDVRRDFGDAGICQSILACCRWNNRKILLFPAEPPSLCEIIYYVTDQLGLDHSKIMQDPGLFRPADAVNMVGDNSPIRMKTGWTYSQHRFTKFWMSGNAKYQS